MISQSKSTDKPSSVYGSSPINRRARRTRREIESIREALYNLLEQQNPMTVRQVFYRLVSQGVIDKTENEYKNSVGRLLVSMRRAGEIPYGWIADATRWQRKPDTYSSLESALRYTARTYRRSLWDDQDVYVEIWTEKDAIAGIIMEETDPWDVPLMVSRGFSSLSYLYEAAEAIKHKNKPAWLYYFGDHDPSGVHIDKNIKQNLRQLAPKADIRFVRLAVRPEQIEEWDLPTRPTKRSDSRGKNFEGESVEVDAIPPDLLRELVRYAITQHVDMDKLEVLRVAEASEREILKKISQRAWIPDEEGNL
jgi:hypothetical protein